MIESHEVERGCVPGVDVHHAVDCFAASCIGAAVTESALHAAACHPDREALRVVIASVAILCVGRASKFTAPDDKCVVEHAALFEISEQRCDWSIHRAALAFEIDAEIAMRVPTTLRDFDEAHAFFRESAGEQALSTESIRARLPDALQL